MADGSTLPAPTTPDPAQAFVPSDIHGLRGVDPQVIMQRVAEGELLREIAKDYGVSRSAVSHYIAQHAPKEQWAQVRETSIAARLEQSAEDMERAPDQLTLARARESARLWMWRAERELPHLYGAKPSTAIQVNGSDGMSVQIVSYANNGAAQQSESSN